MKNSSSFLGFSVLPSWVSLGDALTGVARVTPDETGRYLLHKFRSGNLCNAHDLRSLRACIESIRSGCFGAWSKSSYYLIHIDESGAHKCDRLFSKRDGVNTEVIPLHILIEYQEAINRKAEKRQLRRKRKSAVSPS